MIFKKRQAKSDHLSEKTFSGDTLIEVLLAITIFSAVSVASISLMNSGVSQAQRSLELTMARNEIDAQGEALRFIQNNYVAERELSERDWQFTELWDAIKKHSISATAISQEAFDMTSSITSCQEAYQKQFNSIYKPFIINTRFIQPRTIVENSSSYASRVVPEIIKDGTNGSSWNYDITNGVMHPTETYPRNIYGYLNIANTNIDDLRGISGANNTSEDTLSENNTSVYYRNLKAAEGIWVVAVRGADSSSNRITTNNTNPEYYDFYIRTCWNATGMTTFSTLTTVVRLYNPEIIE